MVIIVEKVPFDPGYSKHVSSFIYFNEQANMMIKSLKTPQQRSFKFRILLPQILDVFKKEAGFYCGCLLWAMYLKYNYKDNPKEIEGNSFLGKSEDDLKKYDYLNEVNYLLEFIKQYPKTLDYYRIKAEPLDNKYKKTVELYKEFLILNKSFINTKMTNDINLPSQITPVNNEELLKIKSLIDATVNDGNFERLFELYYK